MSFLHDFFLYYKNPKNPSLFKNLKNQTVFNDRNETALMFLFYTFLTPKPSVLKISFVNANRDP